MFHTKLLLILVLLLLTLTAVGGGVLRWLFGGDDSGEDSSEEVTDGPFNMITETYEEDDYYDL